METSLIGKALDFGSNEYGFESRVSKYNFQKLLRIYYKIQHMREKKTLFFYFHQFKKKLPVSASLRPVRSSPLL